jgi:hypothetical protein
MSKAAFLATLIAATPATAYAQQWVVETPAPPVVAPGAVVVAPPAYYVPPRPVYPAPVYPAPAPWTAERVVVGDVLPPSVAFYPAPPEYGVTEYRYAIVNDEPVLVEPRTRRVIEVLD